MLQKWKGKLIVNESVLISVNLYVQTEFCLSFNRSPVAICIITCVRPLLCDRESNCRTSLRAPDLLYSVCMQVQATLLLWGWLVVTVYVPGVWRWTWEVGSGGQCVVGRRGSVTSQHTSFADSSTIALQWGSTWTGTSCSSHDSNQSDLPIEIRWQPYDL